MKEEEKHNTFRLKREQYEVPKAVRDDLKTFNATKKKVLEAFGDDQLNIPELAEKTGLSRDEALYYAMTCLKFGWIRTVGLDDMDEFYYYKINK